MILVTGAGGKTGLALIKALQGCAEPVRAFVRKSEQDARVLEAGAAETIVGHLENPQDIMKAVDGIRAVYHICPNMHPAEVEIGNNVIEACKAGKVRHMVFHSVLLPQIEAMPHHWNKLRVEELLVDSGLSFVILQPAAYMQNLLQRLPKIQDEGVYTVPYAVDTRLSMVDLADVVQIAAQALMDPEYLFGTYELVGTGLLSQTEIAERLSTALGRPVKAQQVPLDIWRARAENSGMSVYAIDTLIKMFRYYADFGFRGNSKVLGSLLGRAPTSFEDFVRREIA